MKTKTITTSALFVAVIAICSWISIPIPGTMVPINLGTFGVIMTGYVLGKKNGVISVLIFLLLGAIGLPVFHGFTGGLGILTGPTGGFLIGYIALAFCSGIANDLNAKSSINKQVSYILCVLLGEIILYSAGVMYFMTLTKASLATALLACVLPFLIGDGVKMFFAYVVSARVLRSEQLGCTK